jgi:outer membrane protein assembly factor BamB
VGGLKPAWSLTADLPENFRSSPVVADGCLFATSFGPGPGLGTNLTGSVYAVNADTGELVWHTRVVDGPAAVPGLFAPAIANGAVYVAVSQTPVPYVVALDEATGATLWTTYLYESVADGEWDNGINASMVVFDGMLFVPFYGADLFDFSHPSYYILDAADGKILKKTVVIPQEYWLELYSGGGIWGTAAVDTRTKLLYVGTANPYNKRAEHPHTNAILKIDMDRSHYYTTFGQIVGSYKGEVDYDPDLYNSTQCQTAGEVIPVGYSSLCGQKDSDFGASPNLFTNSAGRTIVGGLQRTPEGIYHALDADTMQPLWTVKGRGGSAATTAYDDSSIYVNTNGSHIYALDKDTGALRWDTDHGESGAHYQPLTVANGVVYTVNSEGSLLALDASTGAQLLKTKLATPAATCQGTAGAGVIVARNTVYATCDTTAGADALAGLPIPTTGLVTGPQPGAVFAYRL